MGVNEFISATDIIDGTGRFMEIVSEADSSHEFVFNDGHTGYMLEYPTFIQWVRDDTWMAINFNHGGARSHFGNNEDIITAIARTLTLFYDDDWDGGGWDDDDWDTGWAYEPAFNRTDYFTGLSRLDLMRFPDNHVFSKVYFYQQLVVHVIEPRVYIVRHDAVQRASDVEYIIVDDRDGSGANAMVGDMISVYGVFLGNEAITWDDGRVEHFPFIQADRFIVNNIQPDLQELSQAIVIALNHHPHAYFRNSQHLGGTRMRLSGLAVGGQHHFRVLPAPAPAAGLTNNIGPRSDGFGTVFNFQLGGRTLADFGIDLDNPNLNRLYIEGFEDLGWVDGVYAYVTGSITSAITNPLEPTMLTLEFTVETIEPRA